MIPLTGMAVDRGLLARRSPSPPTGPLPATEAEQSLDI